MGTLAPLLPGTVTLVAGGPGDAGLMTVAGRAAVEQADVLLVDHLAPQEALAWARPDAEVLDVAKLPRGRTTPQERINELLVEHARAGRRVVRLKGGDGFVFGRGMEEVLACAEAGIEARVLPGVSSAVAVPALAGIPVTHRGVVHGFSVLSGHVPPGHPTCTLDYAALARSGTTLVLLMGVANLAAITAELLAHGLPPTTPAAVVARGGHPDQEVRTAHLVGIATAAEGIAPPAVTVIGEVAAFATATRQLEETR
ncbi:uroporphyrinogen-III C-methyltransferase [Nocardioides sp. Arc9.136]|uniref:uroporphyrinogen-III C-methyltransferase n=1 Tax=Nocardioides sp. Arc9.136 TaxID=2996826 RepID=UPI00266542B6|nr:uroporphyrinogen-III C-methyltransferase [Nocardioides sp. Arc9.136]WKN48922.1 uroporphyrinogen-III C-methyltransferase [Nocardioides sp. Arc9.136]